jgi:hypothetical protein
LGSLRELRLKKPKQKEPELPDLVYVATDSNNYLVSSGINTVYWDSSDSYITLSLDESYEVEVKIDGSTYPVKISQLKEIAEKAMRSGLIDLNNL